MCNIRGCSWGNCNISSDKPGRLVALCPRTQALNNQPGCKAARQPGSQGEKSRHPYRKRVCLGLQLLDFDCTPHQSCAVISDSSTRTQLKAFKRTTLRMSDVKYMKWSVQEVGKGYLSFGLLQQTELLFADMLHLPDPPTSHKPNPSLSMCNRDNTQLSIKQFGPHVFKCHEQIRSVSSSSQFLSFSLPVFSCQLLVFRCHCHRSTIPVPHSPYGQVPAEVNRMSQQQHPHPAGRK
uniref:HDC05696 n=1 Tax=Drosophila melanogaster TaxID=7227 RepID=Q6IGQ4_DROME|nr:TPA_inf: HDC05696 [Drosophila melanogaster]